MPEKRLGLNLRRLSTQNKEGFDKWPESDMPQELGEDISRIDLSTDVKEPDAMISHLWCSFVALIS
jgi:hypothetical protein